MQSKEATWRRRQRWERGDHVPKDTCSPRKPEEAGRVLSWVFSGLGPADTLIWGFWPLEQPLCCSGSLCCSSHRKQVQEQQAALLKTRLRSLVPYFFGKTILNGVDPSDGHVGVVRSLSRIQLLATPWTVARQAPLSTGFSRQEHGSG